MDLVYLRVLNYCGNDVMSEIDGGCWNCWCDFACNCNVARVALPVSLLMQYYYVRKR